MKEDSKNEETKGGNEEGVQARTVSQGEEVTTDQTSHNTLFLLPPASPRHPY